MTGYTREKADNLIDKHERDAARLEAEAREAREYETFDRRHSRDLEEAARRERSKAENLRELKRHHGD